MPRDRVPFVPVRGGTSRGVSLDERDVHERGDDLDALLLAIPGSPDPVQTDGTGGAHSRTSTSALSSAAATCPEGSVAAGRRHDQLTTVRVEHPQGTDVDVAVRSVDEVASVGVTRTARRIADGAVYVDRRSHHVGP